MEARKEWEKTVVSPQMEKFHLSENPTQFYTPVELGDFDFLEKVGFPGQYPFTAGNNALPRWEALAKKEIMI